MFTLIFKNIIVDNMALKSDRFHFFKIMYHELCEKYWLYGIWRAFIKLDGIK